MEECRFCSFPLVEVYIWYDCEKTDKRRKQLGQTSLPYLQPVLPLEEIAKTQKIFICQRKKATKYETWHAILPYLRKPSSYVWCFNTCCKRYAKHQQTLDPRFLVFYFELSRVRDCHASGQMSGVALVMFRSLWTNVSPLPNFKTLPYQYPYL